jgi:Flp pilus assembly protein TadD
LRPGYWKNWNALGALLVRRGDYANAKRAFAEIVRLAPEKNRGYEQLAALAILQGDHTAAVATYQRLPGPVQDAALASNIGTAYFFERRLGEARRYYGLAVELEPRNVTSWTNLGDLFVRAGYADSARAAYRIALPLAEEQLHGAPGDVMARLEHALLLAKSGDCPRAGAELREIASTLTAADAEGWHLAARVYALCGDADSALAGLRRAIALGVPPRVIQAEDEFARLATDSRFRTLLRPAKP